jgi:hypothetical protein
MGARRSDDDRDQDDSTVRGDDDGRDDDDLDDDGLDDDGRDDDEDLDDDEGDDEYEYDPDGVPPMVELGQYPKLATLVLRRRLESAGITTMVEWTGPGPEALGTLLVPEPQSEFAEAVVNELDVDDEVPDTSPAAYLARIEEHLSAIGGLLEELRARVDDLES